MNTKFGMLALILGATLVTGCGEDDKDEDDGDDGGAEDGGTDDGGTSDGGSDGGSSEELVTNPYSSFVGYEWWDLGNGVAAGELNCALAWDTSSSSPNDWYDSDCENCEFMFDVSYDPMKDVWVDDGTCGGSYFVVDGSYGYSSDFFGYGGSWVYDYYGYYYWWGYGDFSGGTFTYNYGYRDYPYYGAYYTYYQYGQADVY